MVHDVDPTIVEMLRSMARSGETPSSMFAAINHRCGTTCHKIDVINYFRDAFALSLKEASPLASCSDRVENEGLRVVNALLLDSYILPAIRDHESDWDH